MSSPSPEAVAVAPTGRDLPALALAVGLGLAAAVGAGSWWAVARRRENDPPEPAMLAAAAAAGATVAGHHAPSPPGATPPAPARRPRPPADWELASALDDAPIGTVDYAGGGDEVPPEIAAALDAPVLHAQPGNARTRRMAEMHSWRDETDRRSLLRRVGLPEVDED
jgi:hypothetical protein